MLLLRQFLLEFKLYTRDRGAMFWTFAFPVLMLLGFGQAAQTYSKWTRKAPVSDFKPHGLFRLQQVGNLEEVGPAGEVAQSERKQDLEWLQIDSYAKSFGVTRKDLINDDLGVFTRVPQQLGIRAAQLPSKLVYKCLLSNPTLGNDSLALFQTVTHKNYQSTGYALNADNLAIAIKYLRNQVDATGEPIDIEPKYLLVPPALEDIARRLCASAVIFPSGGSTSSTARTPTANVWEGKIEALVEPRLENANYPGSSATAWYLVGDPAMIDTLAVGFLNGVDSPMLEAFPMSAIPDALAMQWRVVLDVGVKAAEYRGLVKMIA